MTPEQKARKKIDEKLIMSGWVIQDMKELNLEPVHITIDKMRKIV